MQTRQLGNSDMVITRIGYGAWAIGGGDWAHGWGDQDDNESIAAIQHALDSGINWIDTAAVYGLGHSEEVVAKALKGRVSRPYIFTKCSLVWGDDRKIVNNMKADSVRQEVEDSLRRLQVDVIDLYQIHWPNPDPQIEEGWAEMAKLQQEGKLRWIGVSNFDVEQMKRAQSIAPITSLQPPYSMIKRDVEKEILPYCLQQGIGVIVYSPMQAGLLTGAMTRERAANLPDNDWRKSDEEFTEPRLSRNLQLVDIVKDIANQHGCTPAEVAIAWTLKNPAVTAAIVGARRPDQIDGFIRAAEVELTDADMARIDEFTAANP
jgi:aryl-alcohol dehydrogenase-like predicted oxidoreductase